MPSENSLRPSLTITGLLAVHFFSHERRATIERFHRTFGLQLLSESSEQAVQKFGQAASLFGREDFRVLCCTPADGTSAVSQFLSCHPSGIGALSFSLRDLDRAFENLESRGATIVGDPEESHGVRFFSIATPIPGVLFTFVETDPRSHFLPWSDLVRIKEGQSDSLHPNEAGFVEVDHITANFETLYPMQHWLEEVLGFKRFWEVDLHTRDAAMEDSHGTGLRSVVMWDPESRIKFACNEPLRPNYFGSQIYDFCRHHRGPGIQHVAIRTTDVCAAVEQITRRGGQVVRNPPQYYETLRTRFPADVCKTLDIDRLQELGILVDGKGSDELLLQVFLNPEIDSQQTPSPFFFELIERRGCDGFGVGNFKALFEALEVAGKEV